MTKIIKVLKDFTYYSLIKEAIYSTKNMQATASEIFDYFVLRFPDVFTSYNSMTWKGNIRQVLSKNPEFIKRLKSGSSKQHYWSHRPIEVLMAENKNQVEEVEKRHRAILIDKYPNYQRKKRLNEEDQKQEEKTRKIEFCKEFENTSLFRRGE